MRTLKVTTRTPEEIDAAFAVVCKDIQPLVQHPVTQAERLAPYRKAILKQRRRGLTWDQIAAAMRDPRIGEPVSKKTLREVFEPAGAKPSAGSPAAANPAAAPAAKPPVRHLILDPLTGQRIT